MSKNKTNPELLGTEPIGKLLWRYALPAIIAMTSTSLYHIADRIFIGQGVGAMAISGVGITLPMMNISAAFALLIGVGASSLISIRLGQGNKARAFLILSNALMLNVILGITISILGFIFLDPILYALGASEQTIPYAREYMSVLLYGNVIQHVYMGLNQILRASGYPTKSMFIMLLSVGINLILNAFFIFVLKMGVRGTAWATIISQAIALIPQILHFTNKRNFLYFKPGTFRFIGPIIGKMTSIGLAPFLVNVCGSVVVIFINNALRRTGGDISIGAYSIVSGVSMLFVMIVNGLNQGMQPIVGYNFGARQFTRVLKTLKITIICGVCVTTVGFLLGLLCPGAVASVFIDLSSDPDAMQLYEVSKQGLRISMILFPVVGFQIVASGFFQYIGKPQKAIFLSITRQMLFLVPLIAILPRYYGTMGVWISMPISDLIASLLTAVLLIIQVRQMKYHPETIKVI